MTETERMNDKIDAIDKKLDAIFVRFDSLHDDNQKLSMMIVGFSNMPGLMERVKALEDIGEKFKLDSVPGLIERIKFLEDVEKRLQWMVAKASGIAVGIGIIIGFAFSKTGILKFL